MRNSKAAKVRKMPSQTTHTKRSSVRPWTAEEKKALTTGVARSLYINVTKAAQENKARTARRQAK